MITKTKAKLRVGSVVVFACGGPKMTVVSLVSDDMANCGWFTGFKAGYPEHRRYQFPVAALVVVTRRS